MALKLPGWYHLKKYGKIYAYDAETSDRPDVGISHGFVHFGTSSKGKDRIGFAGISWFEKNANGM